MSKNKNKNHSNHMQNTNHKYHVENKQIKNDESFDTTNYQVEKENHRARMTDAELRDSIINYKVPELDIPDFSHARSLKKNDNSEKKDLLDKLLTEDELSEKEKKNKFTNKYDKEIALAETKKVKPEKTVEVSEEIKEEKQNETLVTNNVNLAERAKRKQEIAKETGGVKTAKRPEQKNIVSPNKKAVAQKKKLKKKLNVKNLVKLVIELIVFIVIIALLIKFISNLFNRPIKINNNIPDGVTISDYTEAPLTNYGIYKTMPEKVRGVYISEYTIASSSNVDKWIKICKETELNALVINVKNDDGRISFEVDYDLAHEIGADEYRTIKDPAELTLKLKQNGIIPIARIVSFKDPFLAKNRSDLALKDSSGNVLAVKSGSHYENWVNPYNKDLWKYVVEVSKCALDMGFKEIQYDYIRFGTGTEMKNASFGFDSNSKTKRDIILEFSQYAKDEIDAYGGYLAADVFGTIITSDYDAEIVGQNYLEMCKIYDYICPMIYPSHYNNGSLGITYPDLDPYHLVLNSLNASKELIDQIPEGEHRATVRAWLQDFTATWVKPHQTYGPQQIREQKQAVYDSGNTQWLLWNAGNNYSTGGLD